MDVWQYKERFWFVRYWLLALVGVLVARSAFVDGYPLAALFVGAVTVVWLGLSAAEALL